MNISPEILRQALFKELPGSPAHLKMVPPDRELKANKEKRRRLKGSSVLLLVYPEKDELFLCLIKRPAHMKHHASQVAFPGGRIEKGETALQTALRETEEEIGIPENKIEILGSLSELFVGVSGFLIYPFVGWLKEKPALNLNPEEVEKALHFPLHRFRNFFDETEVETSSGKLQVPCFRFSGEIIWGATAMILAEFYDVLAELLP